MTSIPPVSTTPISGLQRLVECPKTMTNGPCGGVALDGTCEVDHTSVCVWWDELNGPPLEHDIHISVKPPPDWSPDGRWDSAFENGTVIELDDITDRDKRPERCGSQLETLLRERSFVVTAEINPPDSADPTLVLDAVSSLVGLLDAVHISDNSLASPHMCGLAMAALIEQVGLETILHMTCRDRNRNMLQADLLGAAALGVKHVLCLTGDHPAIGDHPQAKPVFDLDAVSWTTAATCVRSGAFMSGRQVTSAPQLMIGGGAEPTAPPFAFRPQRLVKKIAAGIDFAVTQVVYDMDMFRTYMSAVRELGLHRKIYILASVGALSGPAMARGMNADTPGIVVPEDVIARIEAAPAGRRRDVGVDICVEQIEELLETPGISGIDIMDVDPARYEEIVERCGLRERRQAATE